ncbi:MAG: 4Fe-4S binding protein [Sphaerochaeta sp.]|nr:4Fe-4S binding protein [Sphaerochaeta sp.]
MAFNFLKLFSPRSNNDEALTEKTLVVRTSRCPQNHRCPSVASCPFGALSQKGNRAPVIDYSKCTACGKCTRYCMPRALVMERG